MLFELDTHRCRKTMVLPRPPEALCVRHDHDQEPAAAGSEESLFDELCSQADDPPWRRKKADAEGGEKEEDEEPEEVEADVQQEEAGNGLYKTPLHGAAAGGEVSVRFSASCRISPMQTR